MYYTYSTKKHKLTRRVAVVGPQSPASASREPRSTTVPEDDVSIVAHVRPEHRRRRGFVATISRHRVQRVVLRSRRGPRSARRRLSTRSDNIITFFFQRTDDSSISALSNLKSKIPKHPYKRYARNPNTRMFYFDIYKRRNTVFVQTTSSPPPLTRQHTRYVYSIGFFALTNISTTVRINAIIITSSCWISRFTIGRFVKRDGY